MYSLKIVTESKMIFMILAVQDDVGGEHAKWSHNGLKRCAYGADTVSFSNEQCPSYPVYIGPFPCAEAAVVQLISLSLGPMEKILSPCNYINHTRVKVILDCTGSIHLQLRYFCRTKQVFSFTTCTDF